jgi:hypothetical protein
VHPLQFVYLLQQVQSFAGEIENKIIYLPKHPKTYESGDSKQTIFKGLPNAIQTGKINLCQSSNLYQNHTH